MKQTMIAILLLSLLAACAPAVTPTMTPASAPTATIAATLTPELAPTETSTPTNSPTPTAIPTLPVDAARARLLELLANNGSCQLPCLWGITPGKSSYLDARTILFPLRGIAETAHFDFTPPPVDDISPIYVESDLRLYTRVAYVYGDDDVVNYISFRAIEQRLSKDEYGNQLTAPIFDLPTFMKRTEYYSLAHVLSELGKPASIMFQVTRSIVNGFIDIALLYPDQGIWVNYTMRMFDDENFIVEHGCPINSYVNMFLSPPGDSASFLSILDETDWKITKSGYKPLEEATSMSIEQFYETFHQPTDKCIETPAKLWPTPESGGG